ncbi:alpha/beta hydrolase [Parahaliea mediterranea]|uniref:Monoacylglycerol lipase n=1 Tax=Parahaliea mediterranea TaxID=651086 RepID=A0A939IKR2_9GAMM|nr:alpha/beta hydrolase [Parahaliea mediterranea]MBN7799034.1 lysophospholipase [Parahaliea mediterranea]
MAEVREDEVVDRAGNGARENATLTPEEGRLAGDVYYRHWPPLGQARGVILLVHGLGEHSGRYQGFADYLCPRGFAVVAPDHPGHGESPGTRSHIDRFEDFFPPLDKLGAAIARWYPDLPRFLVGHSMGGLIAARYLLDHQRQFAGAAFSGAALAVPDSPPKILLWINRLLSRLFPRLGLMQLDASEVSRDPEVVRAYRDDPLVHDGKVSARLVNELFRTMGEVEARRAELVLPVLVMHGEADVMTAASGSAAFHAGIGSTDKTLCLYPGLYHEIFNEPERLEVLEELADWLERRCGEAVAGT